jgi:hypothetical protein
LGSEIEGSSPPAPPARPSVFTPRSFEPGASVGGAFG